MSKRTAFPMLPHEYSGTVTFEAEYHGSPCMGGHLIIPWDYRSIMLSSDLDHTYGLGWNEDPGPACFAAFLAYFYQCRRAYKAPNDLEARVLALEQQVAALLQKQVTA